MTRTKQTDTRALRFWRALDAELRACGERSPGLRETETLFACGYNVAQAFRALTGRRPALRQVANF